ncbi:MarR family winged helix-turn-helix transcriptional regulator [Endozoicomonas arenosclerae]|uniref:MarR family winged helix-turn-helix transcriptional regulator n=1 Tax=Endozoicomonas arenosclerae TaxID=1633495 RepID=UPI000784DA24|nr:MarR family transcriptional regulator [Endozoicomonas arenosclerae]
MSESFLKLDQQICFSFYRLSNALVRAYRPLLIELDLTYPQYLVMMVLWNREGCQVNELGEELNLDSGTLTPLLKRLESKGLVERRVSALDERSKQVFLTAKGHSIRQDAECIPMEIYNKMQLSEKEWFQLKQSCDDLFQNIQLLEKQKV